MYTCTIVYDLCRSRTKNIRLSTPVWLQTYFQTNYISNCNKNQSYYDSIQFVIYHHIGMILNNILPGLVNMSPVDWSMADKTNASRVQLRNVTWVSLRRYTCQTQIISVFCNPNGERGEILEEKNEKRPYRYRKTANYIETFSITSVLLAKFNVCVAFVDSRYMKLYF